MVHLPTSHSSGRVVGRVACAGGSQRLAQDRGHPVGYTLRGESCT